MKVIGKLLQAKYFHGPSKCTDHEKIWMVFTCPSFYNRYAFLAW